MTRRDSPSRSRTSSSGPRTRPRRDTVTWGTAASRARVTGPCDSGWPSATRPTMWSSYSGCVRTSGPRSPMTPRSTSTVPSRSGGRSSSPSGTNRRVAAGADRASRSSRGPANRVSRPSLVRMVNRRSRPARSTTPGAENNPPAAATSRWTSSFMASARGVGTRPRPALTRMGSPKACRMRARVRLVAGTDRCSRSAAAVTLCSSNSASRATSRFRSTCVMHNP